MVTMQASLAMRSSMLISPSSATMSVRRGSPYFSLTSSSSVLTTPISFFSLASRLLRYSMRLMSSRYSSSILSRSRPVSWYRRMSRMALAWSSDSLNLAINFFFASSRSSASLMILTTASMLSSAMRKPSRMWARSSAFCSSNLRAARDDFLAVRDVALDHLLDVHDPRPAVVDRQHDHAEGVLELGVLVEVVDDDLRNGVALQLDDDADAFLVGFVADVGRCRRASCR